jgi:hypothetical protein
VPVFVFAAAVSHQAEDVMRHRIPAILAVAVLALFSGKAFAAGTSGFALNVLVDDAPRSEYHHRGAVYVEAIRGASYSLRLTNPTGVRVAVALSVDGLNTIDAKHTDARSASKWVLEPYESVVISGWQVSDRAARSFFFTGERSSYGAALGQTENLGVIEAVYFRERRREEVYRPHSSEESSKDRDSARSQAGVESGVLGPSTAAPRKEKEDDYAATGMGERARHEIQMVDIDLESNPVASVRIRYEFRPQLVKLGILPERVSTLERRERASGFKTFCPEPK